MSRVVAAAAVEPVGAAAADERVVPDTADEDLGARVADDRVVPEAADDHLDRAAHVVHRAASGAAVVDTDLAVATWLREVDPQVTRPVAVVGAVVAAPAVEHVTAHVGVPGVVADAAGQGVVAVPRRGACRSRRRR